LQYQRSGCDKQHLTGAPFRLKNICWNGAPPRSGTTTPLHMGTAIKHLVTDRVKLSL